MNADQAIKRSISHNETVTLDYDISLALDLSAACDDNVETASVVEYWGTDDNGNEWRVHLSGDRDERLAATLARP